ncbi:unnamed protein product [Anisakis simplex]|uniref:Uncharacterized protein n=1 Tax=Anisakis simplex TaxID=6269 RepID=A0A0M3K6F6_ANISI|nr:unnamed protein product [Anisakis simplex]
MKQPSLDDRFSMENAYSTPADNLSPDWHGYGNPLYGNNRGLTATHEGMHGRRYYDRGSGLYDKAGGADRSEVIVPIEKRQTTTFQDTMNHRQHGSNSNLDDQLRLPLQSNGTLGGDYYHETFEEKFEEKYEIDERSASPSDSRELL